MKIPTETEGSLKEISLCPKIPRDNFVNTKDKGIFLEKNHIQGKVGSSVNIGLYHQDKLVSLMTFGKPRMDKVYEYELLRFCNEWLKLFINPQLRH